MNVTWPSNQAAVLRTTYQGSENFVVTGYDASGDLGPLFVNTIGNYDGVRLFDVDADTSASRLQVQASGPWTITINPLMSAPTEKSPGTYNGTGDTVLLIKGSPAIARFHNTGRDNFVVTSYTNSSKDVLINKIGVFDGAKVVPPGTLLFEVQSDGAWSATLS